ncbi:MAG: RNA polymerase sigma factor [Pseudonocardiaceae bacterium]
MSRTAATRCAPATALEAAELLQRAGENDPVAWEEILRRYRSVVVATVRAFRLQEADTRDVVQMTWLRLAENTHRIRHPEQLGGWLATTARRECLHILRHAKRTPFATEAVVDNLADPAVGPEQRVIDTETAQMLRKLVAELPPRRRSLLGALFTDHPRPYAELAATVGIPVGSIGPTRNRALYQLRQMLEDRQLVPQVRR